MRAFIGFDSREPAAYDVALRSLHRHSPGAHVTPLIVDRLAEYGLLNRPVDRRDDQIYDVISNAPCSTDFAISRFLVPHLAQTGFALFVDSDVVFFADIDELLTIADPRYAVMVVKHPNLPAAGTKMDGKPQIPYPRKNWSSVLLYNCDHPANRRLSLHDVNTRPGRDLHAFYWLADSEIGELPAGFNWLVNVQPRPADLKIAHFTLGGPFTPGWPGAEHDDLWNEAARAA